MDTIQIHQTIDIPASKASNTIPMDIDGYMVVNNDSLNNLMYSIKESAANHYPTIDTLSEKINTISDHGIGYHDSVGIIVIPLIIALFAFTMPLLFQVITHINSKYSSQSIAEMFKNTFTYKLFWGMSIFSIGYLFILGILSLSTNGETYHGIMLVANWISLLVAIAYASITLLFVWTCIKFNSPQKLLSLIGKQYRDELQFDNIRLTLKKINRLKDNAQFWKSKGWKSIQDFTFRGAVLFAHYKTNTDYGERITDLCKYSMNNKNNSLFLSVLLEVDKITKHEKKGLFDLQSFSYEKFVKKSYLPFIHKFYNAAVEYYTHCDYNPYFEDLLIRHWLNSFMQSRFPVDKEIVEIVRTVVTAVENGYIGIYEKYIDKSGFDYLFIHDLQIVAFVEGAGINDQIKIDDERRKLWKRICDLHFLMNAYLLSKGHYEILKPLLNASYYDKGYLYPLMPDDILAEYVNVKEKVHEFGYESWSNKDMFGREVNDKDWLEEFTVILMMLTSDNRIRMRGMAPDESINRMKESKTLLTKHSNKAKTNKELQNIYPEIKDVKFDELYDSCIEAFDKGALLESNVNNTSEYRTSFCKRIESFLSSLGIMSQKGINHPDIYQLKLPEEKRELFENDVLNVFRNTGWIPQGLNDNPQKGEYDCITLQELSMIINKRYLCNYGDNFGSPIHLQRHIETIFEKRAIYMVLSAISRMIIKEVNIRVGDFERKFNSYTKGRNKNYVIIDVDCELSIMLDTEHSDSFFESNYKGADYKRLYIDSSPYMKDLPLPDQLRDHLFILKKEDYPSLIKSKDGAEPSIVLKDLSNRNKGLAVFSLLINPNMELKFHRTSNVLMVHLIR